MQATTPHPPAIDLANETVVTIAQAAEHYAVSRPTMWRWVLSGKVASAKLGGSRRTTLEAVARSFMGESGGDSQGGRRDGAED